MIFVEFFYLFITVTDFRYLYTTDTYFRLQIWIGYRFALKFRSKISKSKNVLNHLPLQLSVGLAKQVILAIDMNNPILQYTLPLVLVSRNLFVLTKNQISDTIILFRIFRLSILIVQIRIQVIIIFTLIVISAVILC